VRGPDRVVGAAVEGTGEGLLGLAEFLPGRLDRGLGLGDLLQSGVNGRADLGDAGQ
jgi:hypothetical protein